MAGIYGRHRVQGESMVARPMLTSHHAHGHTIDIVRIDNLTPID